MASEEQSYQSGPRAEPLRRDARDAAAALPSAAPVRHGEEKPAAVNRGRLIAGFAAVVLIGLSAMTASILGAGSGDVGSTVTADLRAFDQRASVPSDGERGRPHDRGPTGADESDTVPQTDAREQTDADAQPVPGDDPQSPGPGSDAGTSDSGAANPAPSAPSASAVPAPAPAAPAPPAPAQQPTPDPPSTAPQPVAPKPLAFTGLTENRITLLGIPLLSGYTLSLSGEPGSRASVTYGSRPAGSVTFDGSGHVGLTIGGSLLNTELSNPVIRAAYSDGTAGAAVEARRDSI
jgi:hypothetical protein